MADRYEVFRNGSLVYNTTNTTVTAFLDGGLAPDTTYVGLRVRDNLCAELAGAELAGGTGDVHIARNRDSER